MPTYINNLEPDVINDFEQKHSLFHNYFMLGQLKGKNGRWSKSDTLRELLNNY